MPRKTPVKPVSGTRTPPPPRTRPGTKTPVKKVSGTRTPPPPRTRRPGY